MHGVRDDSRQLGRVRTKPCTNPLPWNAVTRRTKVADGGWNAKNLRGEMAVDSRLLLKVIN